MKYKYVFSIKFDAVSDTKYAIKLTCVNFFNVVDDPRKWGQIH